MQRIKYLAVFVVLLMAGCRDKDLDMTVLNKSLFDGADFTEIVLNDSWNVTIVQDDEKTGIDLEYSAFLEDYLDVKQEKKNLSIAFTHRLNLPYNTVMNAVIHVKTLEKLILKDAVTVKLQGDFTGELLDIQFEDASICREGSYKGNATVKLKDASHLVDFNLDGDYFEMQIKGASSFKGNLIADSVNVAMEDASRLVTFNGQVQRVRLSLEDASILNMVNSPVDEAFVELHDSSEATLYVNHLLQGILRDASKVYYQGHPSINLDCDDASSYQPL